MPVTLTMFLACVLWGRFLLSRQPRMLAAAGILFGLALAAKFAAFALIPVFVLLYLVRWWQERASRPGAASPRLPALGLHHWFAATAKMSLLAAAVIFAAYGLELRTPLSDSFTARQLEKSFDEVRSDRRVMPALAWALNPDTPAGRTVRWLGSHVPVPAYSFVKGLYVQVAHSRTGHPTYLLGTISQRENWLYFPVAFIVKSPFSLLLLLIVALILCSAKAARRPLLSRLRSLPFSWYQIFLPIAVYLCFPNSAPSRQGFDIYCPSICFLSLASVPYCSPPIEAEFAGHYTAFSWPHWLLSRRGSIPTTLPSSLSPLEDP
jgi:4-amino-4-deoxy-L-arabinose transferase-like glycosyltransferase